MDCTGGTLDSAEPRLKTRGLRQGYQSPRYNTKCFKNCFPLNRTQRKNKQILQPEKHAKSSNKIFTMNLEVLELIFTTE